jgi:FkbM family methyltransferase
MLNNQPISALFKRAVAWARRKTGEPYKRSYSQCGEDLIVSFVLETVGIARPSYLDLGAHHPCHLNNTYLFYRQGSRGVNVEADPVLAARLKRARPGDVTLNVGVGPQAGRLQFYVMSPPTLSTFSAEEANRYCKEFGHRIIRIIDVQVHSFMQLVQEHFESAPDFVTLDVEGLDLPIVRSIDFSSCRPLVLCIETLSYSESGQGRRTKEIDSIMEGAGYLRYGDTHINTIYVDEARWRRL